MKQVNENLAAAFGEESAYAATLCSSERLVNDFIYGIEVYCNTREAFMKKLEQEAF